MRSWLVSAVALLVVMPAAHAQNKCVDAKGKVTYQQDPCPGSVRAPAQAPVAPAKPAAAPAQSRNQAAALAEQQRCVSDWETIAAALQRSREEIAGQRARGEDSSREEQVSRQYMETSVPRFLSACGKYGFDEPRDEQMIQINAAAARGLQRRIDESRQESDVAASREAAKEAAAAAAKPRATLDTDCRKAGRQLSQRRAGLAQLPPERRADEEGAVNDLDRLYRKECSKD
jgi:hypothetical protein